MRVLSGMHRWSDLYDHLAFFSPGVPHRPVQPGTRYQHPARGQARRDVRHLQVGIARVAKWPPHS